MEYKFSSKKDKDACMEYCKQLIKRRNASPTLEFATSSMLVETNSPPHELKQFWDNFLEVIANTYKNKEVDDLKPDYPWGCWQITSEDAVENAPTLWVGQVNRHDEGAYQVHNYQRPLRLSKNQNPEDPGGSGHNYSGAQGEDRDSIIEWDLLIAKQEGRDVLVGAVNVGEIDAVCMVPHLPNFADSNQGSILLADWSMDPNAGLSQWQRRPDPIRVKSITNFIESSNDNLIINSIMLYIPENAPGVKIIKNGNFAKIIIDSKKFLAPNGELLTDVTITKNEGEVIYTDHRPLWIVDGQHRTRGMAMSPRGSGLDVPVVVTHGGGEDIIRLDEVAKVFTEINTLANPLDSFQQHYLSHKFSIVASDKDKTYGEPSRAYDESDKKNRLANIRMYKLASLLTKDEDGPFYNGVQLVKGQGAAMMTRIKIQEFVKQMRPLFVDGIYSDERLSIDEIHNDFSNYLAAWENTANYHQWPHMPNKKRWEPNRSNASELEQSQPIVWIIFKTFEFIREYAIHRNMDVSEETYTKILAPIRGIDWYSKELTKAFEQQYRPASIYMSVWIKQAILNGIIRSPEEVHSIESGEVHHGVALYAEPSAPTVTVNHGAISTTIMLTWEHGNVYREPDDCYLFINNKKENVADSEWEFSTPKGNDELPSIARYSITISNEIFEETGWELHVETRCMKKTGKISITPDTLPEW